MRMAKLTSKNQLMLPAAVVAALGHPSHFRVQVHEGVLLLWPGRWVGAALPSDGREDKAAGPGK